MASSSVALDLLKKAEEYLLQLEQRIKKLEEENARKEEVIRRLSASVPAEVAAAATAGLDAAPAAAAAAAPAAESAPAATPAPAPLVIDKSKPIVPIVHKTPTLEEKVEHAVYDDDPALGKPVPADEWKQLLWFNAGSAEGVKEAVAIGGGKPILVTFFSNLNKGDYVTLSVLSELKRDPRFSDDKVLFCAISRDSGEEDVPKFLRKINGGFFGELTNTDGSPGVTVVADYPLAYDKDDTFNKMMKKVMVKGTVGVGMVIVIDGEGIIRWYEKFIRGVNPMNQLETVLEAIVAGQENPVSNGKRPVASDEDEELAIEGEIPDDAFAGDTAATVKKDGY